MEGERIPQYEDPKIADWFALLGLKSGATMTDLTKKFVALKESGKLDAPAEEAIIALLQLLDEPESDVLTPTELEISREDQALFDCDTELRDLIKQQEQEDDVFHDIWLNKIIVPVEDRLGDNEDNDGDDERKLRQRLGNLQKIYTIKTGQIYAIHEREKADLKRKIKERRGGSS